MENGDLLFFVPVITAIAFICSAALTAVLQRIPVLKKLV